MDNERQVKLKDSLIDPYRKRIIEKVKAINLLEKLPKKLEFEEILQSLNNVTKNINQDQN